MKKKILIVIADIGNGHRSAANAITSVVNKNYPDQFEVKTIDLFEESEVEPFNSSDISYKFLSQNRAYESVSNVLWKFTNTQIGFDLYKSYLVSRILDVSEKIINQENPDLVISAFPLTCSVIQALKQKGATFKYAVTVTDLMTIHRSWADPTADLISSPTEDATEKLIEYGAEKEKIVSPLFPLRPELSAFRSKEEVFEELNLDLNIPTVLITGGGLGTKAISDAIYSLGKRDDIQTIVIAGRLESFKKELESHLGDRKNVKILGFIKNMQDYYNSVDIVVGKPGATTVMEIELFDKKAIYTRYIGEHDSGNVEYALRNPRARYIGDDWNSLNKLVDELINLPSDTPASKKRSFDECEKIVDEIVKLIS